MATVSGEFKRCAAEYLTEGLAKLEHCVSQLSDEQLWWRPFDDANSVANILLHVSGNLRQWVVSGLGGAVDERNRPAEFAQRGGVPREEILERLRDTVREACEVATQLDDDALLELRHIQGYDLSALQAVFHVVEHFRGHVQEVVYITRMQLRERYRFFWVPQTPEQISARQPPC